MRSGEDLGGDELLLEMWLSAHGYGRADEDRWHAVETRKGRAAKPAVPGTPNGPFYLPADVRRCSGGRANISFRIQYHSVADGCSDFSSRPRRVVADGLCDVVRV